MICRRQAACLAAVATVVSAEGGAPRVALLHMQEVFIRAAGGVTTVLAHKDLGTSLSVGVLLVDAVNLSHVGLQGASLREGLVAQLTFIRTNTCNMDIKGEFCRLCGNGCKLFDVVMMFRHDSSNLEQKKHIHTVTSVESWCS